MLSLCARACRVADPVQQGRPCAVIFWIINLGSIGLSLVATVCVVMERVRGFKEQGIIERMAGCDATHLLKKFIAGSEPFGDDLRAQFPHLALKFSKIQHEGTSQVYNAFKPSRGNTTKESEEQEEKIKNTLTKSLPSEHEGWDRIGLVAGVTSNVAGRMQQAQDLVQDGANAIGHQLQDQVAGGTSKSMGQMQQAQDMVLEVQDPAVGRTSKVMGEQQQAQDVE